MLIQHFTMKERRVADPMRPGRSAAVGYLTASCNTEYSYTDPHTGEDVTAFPDGDGWLEVPHEVGLAACSHRIKGSGFYTPEEIGDEVRLGRFDGAAPEADEEAKRPSERRQASPRASKPARRGRSKAAEEEASTGAPDPDEPGDIVGPDGNAEE